MDEQPTPPPGRDLPAPYQDPWMLLGRDLRALLATARLRGWELARRNRQGDLAVPGFWPRELRAWFWPLALALVLVLLLALVVLVPPLLPHRSTPLPQPPPAPGSAPRPPSESPSASPAELPAEPAAGPPPPADLADLSVQAPSAAAESPAAAEPLQDQPAAIDSLLALLQPVDPRGLIGAVREQPARSCLQLNLSDRFAALAPALQGQQAEAWRVRALELGYERLELVDGAGRLLARTARVGSGMILLSSADPVPDAP